MTLVSRSCFLSIYFFVLKKKSTVHDIKIKRYFSNMENKCRDVKKTNCTNSRVCKEQCQRGQKEGSKI